MENTAFLYWCIIAVLTEALPINSLSKSITILYMRDCYTLFSNESWDSRVRIAMRLWARQPRNWDSVPGKKQEFFFFLSTACRPAFMPTTFLPSGY
jgi:hypothetical protein